MPRLTKAQRARAVERADELLGSRASFRSTTDTLAAEYGISERTAERIIAEVYERWRTEDEEARPRRRAEQRRSLLSLYRKADAAGELRTCVDIERLLMRLDGTESAEPAKEGVTSVIELLRLGRKAREAAQ